MAVRVSLQVQGLNEIQRMLEMKKNRVIEYLDMRLMQIAEEAVTYSKENKGYHDRTANLKNSISYALYYNGQLLSIQEGRIPHPEATEDGQSGVREAIEDFASKNVEKMMKGYSLIVVAGMSYGVYVERRGYNVLYLTEHWLREKLGEVIDECKDVFAQ